MPDHAPTYSHHAPAHRDSVISLADAVTRLWPAARVDTSHAGPTSAWVQRVALPYGPTGSERSVIIALEWRGWQARDLSTDPEAPPGYIEHAVPSANRNDLISVIHDAFAWVHNRTHALGA